MGSHKSGLKGQNPLPRPAGHAALGAAQVSVGRLVLAALCLCLVSSLVKCLAVEVK